MNNNPNDSYLNNGYYNNNQKNNNYYGNQNGYYEPITSFPKKEESFYNVKRTLIIILVIIVFAMVILMVINLLKSYDVRIYLNGADSVEHDEMHCKSNLLGQCYLTLPNALRYDGEVLGYSKKHNSKEAEYKIGQKIRLNGNLALFVVSRKDNILKIDKSNIDDIEDDDLKCSTYNTESQCGLTVPLFNKRGYETVGYTEHKGGTVATIHPGDEYKGDKILYPVYDKFPNYKTYNTKSSFRLSNAYVDVESSCDDSIAKIFTEYIKKVDEKWPFLFHGQKIVFMGENEFFRFVDSSDTVYGGTFVDIKYPGITPSVLRCVMPSNNSFDMYMAIVHELVHSFDFQYEGIFNKGIGKERDVVNLFNKYREYPDENKPLRTYAYYSSSNDPKNEFIAEVMTYYYLNYVDKDYVPVKPDLYSRGNYPDDMKEVAEKYLCIGVNNFDKRKCN